MREWKIYQNFQKNVFLSAKFRQDNRIDPILERKENFSRMKIPGLGLNRLSIPVESTFFLSQ